MLDNLKKNTGTTLIELMVYMIIGLIVITAVFQVVSDAAGGYSYGRSVSKAQFNARDAVNVMARDIASMGNKIYIESGNSTQSPVITWDSVGLTEVERYVEAPRHTYPGNQAAFFFGDGGATVSDTLEFYRLRLKNDGTLSSRDKVEYFQNGNKQIVRRLHTWVEADENWANKDSTIIASNVVALNFRFGRIGDDSDWTSSFDATTKRSDIRHIEIAILVKAHKQSRQEFGAEKYFVGDREYITPEADRQFIHRLYRQSIEVPNNATGIN